jgi:hypothetical protein
MNADEYGWSHRGRGCAEGRVKVKGESEGPAVATEEVEPPIHANWH